MRAIGIGDNVVDRYVDRRVMFPGGNAVNFAVYCKQCGEEAAYLGNIADDVEGRMLRSSLVELGIDVSMSPLREGMATERCDVTHVDGDRCFQGCSYGEGEWTPLKLNDENLEYLKGFDLIHCACYGEMADEMCKLADLKACKTYDFSSEEEYREDEYLKKVCPYIDVALFSAEDMDESEILALQKKAHDFGAGLVLVTNGSKGQTLWDGNELHRGKVKLIKPVDTMGAGDSFFASFVVTYLRCHNYEEAFAYAADFSAKTCLVEGAFGFGTEY